MNNKAVIFASFMILIVLTFGCAARKSSRDTNYQTVSADPHRDVESARELNAQGLLLLEKAKVQEAEQKFKAALDGDVIFGPAHNNLGKVYFRQGKLYLAAWEFQYASKLMTDRPEPKNNLGLVLEEVGKLDDAVGWYQQASDLAPDSPEYLGNLARAKVRRGDHDLQTRELLSTLIDRETRPKWREWAQEQLILMGGRPASQPATMPWENHS